MSNFSFLRKLFFDSFEMERLKKLVSVEMNSIANVDSLFPFKDGISFRNEFLVYQYIVHYLESLVLSDARVEELKTELDSMNEFCKKKICWLFIIEEQKMLMELLPQYMSILEKLAVELETENQEFHFNFIDKSIEES